MNAYRANGKVWRSGRIVSTFRRTLNFFRSGTNCFSVTFNQFIRDKNSSFYVCNTNRIDRFFQAFICRRRGRVNFQVINYSYVNSVFRRSNLANLKLYRRRYALTFTSKNRRISGANERIIIVTFTRFRFLVQRRQNRIFRQGSITRFIKHASICFNRSSWKRVFFAQFKETSESFRCVTNLRTRRFSLYNASVCIVKEERVIVVTKARRAMAILRSFRSSFKDRSISRVVNLFLLFFK